jgi:hypothetical protein
LRLIDAAPGARALVIDRTAMEGVVRPDGLPEGRIVGAAVVDARGEARFALPQEAFAARVPLAAVVTVGGRFVLVGSVTLPGSSPVASQASSGQSRLLLVTEFMKDPSAVSDTSGEWIEVHNPLPWRLNLEGWSIGNDAGPEHVIANGGAGVYVLPGGYAVLGRNADPATNGGVAVDYVYSTTSLGNGADEIVLRKRNGQVADRVAYDDGVLWPDLAGQSISLTPSATDPAANDDPANWCHAVSAIGGAGSDLGTPGAANDVCP